MKQKTSMPTAKQRAEHFLRHERAFHLGAMLTESSHPKTTRFSQTIRTNVEAGIRMLGAVDAEIPPVAERIFASVEFQRLVDAMREAVAGGRRVFFTGCGATGRLSILLEAAWRRFWQTLLQQHPAIGAKFPELEDATRSVMAGGDHALIRSVEGFEDFTFFGKYQLGQAGVGKGDVVVAITEGGETSFVIGTAWKGIEVGATPFFVYNNPTELLRAHVQRSREVIEDARITKLDLTTGPMAVAGSTRMQATTIELLVVGAALEMALVSFLETRLSNEELAQLGVVARSPEDYHKEFARLLEQLGRPSAVAAMAAATLFEESVYRRGGLVTYMTDAFLLDVLTDTTERAPTFRLPPFRKCDDTRSARSWAFIKNPLVSTPEAWVGLLRRPPRGLDWNGAIYRKLNAPEILQQNPPKLDNGEIVKFLIGNEPDPSRHDAEDSALLAILVGDEIESKGEASSPFMQGFRSHEASFARTAALCVGPKSLDGDMDQIFHVAYVPAASPLALWDRLAVKLVLNTVSTATMGRMGRVLGNWMAHVETTNKKLIDRGTRLIAELTGLDYNAACLSLHETIAEVKDRDRQTKDAPSPVALAIERIGLTAKYRFDRAGE